MLLLVRQFRRASGRRLLFQGPRRRPARARAQRDIAFDRLSLIELPAIKQLHGATTPRFQDLGRSSEPHWGTFRTGAPAVPVPWKAGPSGNIEIFAYGSVLGHSLHEPNYPDRAAGP